MILPALDLINGEVVRLKQGDYQQKTRYDFNPGEQALRYGNDVKRFIDTTTATGQSNWLHLVDLDGAKNSADRQRVVLKELLSNKNQQVQLGGGVRSPADVEELLSLGANRVVIGSMAIKQPEVVKGLIEQYGPEAIVLALDINIDADGNKWLPTHGWIKQSDQTLEPLVDDYLTVGVKHILCTDISKDGMLQGSNVALYQQLVAQFPDIHWQASGGISSLDDIRQLKPTGVKGVILGRSLLEGEFTLPEALACWQDA